MQLGILLGVFLSNEYHKLSGYTLWPDKTYYEILCNLAALAGTFGEDKVREFAPELIDYLNSFAQRHENAVRYWQKTIREERRRAGFMGTDAQQEQLEKDALTRKGRHRS